MYIGKPIVFDANTSGASERAQYQKISDEIMFAIDALKERCQSSDAAAASAGLEGAGVR